jgi:hypothetical protein
MTRRTFVNGSLAAQLAGGPWSLIFEERFTPGFDARWIREGEASYEPRTEAGRRFLRIATRQSPVVKQMHQSVFWRRERLEGDLRFVFRARAEKGNTEPSFT